MIRYVYIGDQIERGERQFAFWDTVGDFFTDVGGYTLFDSLDDFESAAEFEDDKTLVDRCRSLIPKGPECIGPANCEAAEEEFCSCLYCRPDKDHVTRCRRKEGPVPRHG